MGAGDVRAGGAFVELFAKDQALGVGLHAAQSKLKSFASGMAVNMAFAAQSIDGTTQSFKALVQVASAFAVQSAFAKGNVAGVAVAAATMLGSLSMGKWDAWQESMRAGADLMQEMEEVGDRQLTQAEELARQEEKILKLRKERAALTLTGQLNPFGSQRSSINVDMDIVNAERKAMEMRRALNAKQDQEDKKVIDNLKGWYIKRIDALQKVDVMGTFNASAMDRQGFGKSLADREQETQERSLDTLIKIYDTLKNGDLAARM